ncbi:anaerobic ribonucleoside triphosphate reductase [Campylobacterota bacterium]|nr:anaerobic ribonucleoside triphosphate reductase [Campylobacterota bacterium]
MGRYRVRTITKRDGRVTLYDENKIAAAILKALIASGTDDAEKAAQIAREVGEILATRETESYRIEEIQDEAEKALMRFGFVNAAKKFILYRAARTRVREANTSLMEALDEITNADARSSDLKRDNANVDGNTAMGSMLQLGMAAAKAYNSTHLLTEPQAIAHSEGAIHIHDFDFYSLTTTCCQIDIDKLFRGGFSTGHGFLREPQSIESYAALACIAIQSNQNDQHGGQSIPNFDYALGAGVAKTYKRLFAENLAKSLSLIGRGDWDKLRAKALCAEAEKLCGVGASLEGDRRFLEAAIAQVVAAGEDAKAADRAVSFAKTNALSECDRKCFQSMEALVHNLNSMHSRAGAQTPFSSINYGTDTTPEGRMIVRNLLLATEAGLGHSETPIFPIQIFKLKSGVNYNQSDPNYDLFELACRCSAKRLFPNFTNLDAPFNLKYYVAGRPETEVATMGCRTRVMANNFDENNQIAFGRGNLSFTSINLPRLAIEAKGDENRFFASLREVMDLVAVQLLDRYAILAKKRVRNFPFLMGQGIWIGSDKLGADDEIGEVLKHGTLSIGFIGLAETLKSLYGAHHGESKAAQKKGLKIVSFMNDFCVEKGREMRLNFTLLATPAEGLSGRFLRIDKKRYGTIEGVTDRDYYTNSFHIPVYCDLGAYDKIRLEAPYHALTPAGHITYVELDGDTAKNTEAFMAIVRAMHDAGVGYGSINHPVDRDPVCGFVGIIDDVCPRCGRREGEAISPQKLIELRKNYPLIAETYGHDQEN